MFNQGVNCWLLSGNFLISVSRWSQWCRTESKSLWQSLKRLCGKGKGYACLCAVICVHLCFCSCLLCCSHSVDVCVCKCLIVFAAVWLSIYPHILFCLSHPLNDAQQHFSLSLSRSLVAWLLPEDIANRTNWAPYVASPAVTLHIYQTVLEDSVPGWMKLVRSNHGQVALRVSSSHWDSGQVDVWLLSHTQDPCIFSPNQDERGSCIYTFYFTFF